MRLAFGVTCFRRRFMLAVLQHLLTLAAVAQSEISGDRIIVFIFDGWTSIRPSFSDALKVKASENTLTATATI